MVPATICRLSENSTIIETASVTGVCAWDACGSGDRTFYGVVERGRQSSPANAGKGMKLADG
jgi:hypothetical protein